MNNDQHIIRGASQSDKTFFGARMQRIGNRYRKRVTKNRGRFNERNAMLFEIARRFAFVPLELNHAFSLLVDNRTHHEVTIQIGEF